MNVLTRIRFWLIKKLGGSIEPLLPFQPTKFEVQPVTHLITLGAEITVGGWSKVKRDESSHEYLRRELARKIADGLMNQGLIRFQEDMDVMYDQYTIRGRVTVAQKNND